MIRCSSSQREHWARVRGCSSRLLPSPSRRASAVLTSPPTRPPHCAVVALVAAFYFVCAVRREEEGNARMRQLRVLIYEGAYRGILSRFRQLPPCAARIVCGRDPSIWADWRASSLGSNSSLAVSASFHIIPTPPFSCPQAPARICSRSTSGCLSGCVVKRARNRTSVQATAAATAFSTCSHHHSFRLPTLLSRSLAGGRYVCAHHAHHRPLG